MTWLNTGHALIKKETILSVYVDPWICLGPTKYFDIVAKTTDGSVPLYTHVLEYNLAYYMNFIGNQLCSPIVTNQDDNAANNSPPAARTSSWMDILFYLN
jgi:hypothetical protein